jgi:hypothetical protein
MKLYVKPLPTAVRQTCQDISPRLSVQRQRSRRLKTLLIEPGDFAAVGTQLTTFHGLDRLWFIRYGWTQWAGQPVIAAFVLQDGADILMQLTHSTRMVELVVLVT